MLRHRAGTWLAIGTIATGPGLACAQTAIVTDGTLGAPLVLDGMDVEIPAELGQTRGGNLFHSFARFDIGTGARASFTGPDGLSNVISRVTGGTASAIDGTLASRVAGADVWLINPAGVLFGPDARLDVPAGFHVSTADRLRFADGAVFDAADPAASTLTIADPASFGFLGDTAGAIGIIGASLSTRAEQSLSLVGGDIGIIGNAAGSLVARDGSIRLVAVDGAAEVTLDPAAPAAPGGGAITLRNQASISTAGRLGGRIAIDGGTIVLGAGSEIDASRFGAGVSDNDVILHGRDVTLDASRISTRTLGEGDAGDITIVADTLDLASGGVLDSSTGSGGAAGNVAIDADAITIRGDENSLNTGIVASAGPGSRGDAGTIDIRSGSLQLLGGGMIASGTNAQGRGGTIEIDAGTLRIERGDTLRPTGLFADAGLSATGDAGLIRIDADSLTLANGGAIASDSSSDARAGTVQIVADRVLLDGMFGVGTAIRTDARFGSGGDAGRVQIRAGTIDLRRGGNIRSETSAAGDAGRIDIVADRLSLDAENGSVTDISVSTAPGSTGAGGRTVLDVGSLEIVGGATITGGTDGTGRAGTVIVTADRLRIDSNGAGGQTGILSQTGFDATGGGGSIQVTASDIELIGTGQIGTSTFGDGDAGSIRVEAGRLVSDGRGASIGGINSTSSSSAGGGSGAIEIVADAIELRDGGSIDTSMFGQGESRNITIVAGSLLIDGSASQALTGVSSSTGAGTIGDAGDISITVDHLAVLGDGMIDSDTGGAGAGGNIEIVAETLRLDGRNTIFLAGILSESGIDATGAGGTIDINAGMLDLRNGMRIASRTFSAAPAGQIRIRADSIIVDAADRSDTSISSEANTGGGAAGRIEIAAGSLALRRGGRITSSTFGGGNAGSIELAGGTIRLSGSSAIESSSLLAGGSAGDIRIFANQLLAQDSAIRTTGATAAGGRIDTTARQAIRFDNSEITTSGALPQAGASILTLNAPFIEILAASRMLSLAGTAPALPDAGVPTGAARVVGAITVISDDSEIAATTDVDIQGLDAEFGSGLQLSEASPIDIDRLLSAACAIDGESRAASSFGRARQPKPASPSGTLSSVSSAAAPKDAC